MPRRGTLLKDLTRADFVMALDAYRDDTGRDPAASLEGVPCGYLRGLGRERASALSALLPWEWLFLPAEMTRRQLVAAAKQCKVLPWPKEDAEWQLLMPRLMEYPPPPLLYEEREGLNDVRPRWGRTFWPKRVYEAAFLSALLARTVTDPGKYLVDLGKPPSAFRRPPEAFRPVPALLPPIAGA